MTIRNYKLMLSLFYFSISLIFVGGYFYTAYNLMAICLVLIFLILFFLSNDKVESNFIFKIFLIVFFTFLMGRIFVSNFFGYKIEYRGLLGLDFTNPNLVSNLLMSLYLSLTFLFLGYYFIRDKIKINFDQNINKNRILSLRYISLVLFYIAIILRLYTAVDFAINSVQEGYFNIFLTYRSNLPRFLQILSQLSQIFYFAFLATLPKQRSILIPTSLYLLEGFIFALGGSRSVFIQNLLVVVLYYFIRNRNEPENKWIKKSHIIFAVFLLPILLFFMSIIGENRSGQTEFNFGGIVSGVVTGGLEFFYSQGVSANLIGYTDVYRNDLPRDHYTFGPFFEFTANIIRNINGQPSFSGQNVDRATNGFLYSQALPFLIDPQAYLRGFGYGSSFVAENYFDLGFFGVTIGSFFMGWIIAFVRKILKSKNFFMITFGLAMFRGLILAPRASYFSFVVEAFTLENIFSVLIIYLLSFVLVKKSR